MSNTAKKDPWTGRSQEVLDWISFLNSMKVPFTCTPDMDDALIISVGKSFRDNLKAESLREKAKELASLKKEHLTAKRVKDEVLRIFETFMPVIAQEMEVEAKAEWSQGGSVKLSDGGVTTHALKVVNTKPDKEKIKARKEIKEAITHAITNLIEGTIGVRWINSYYSDKKLDREAMSEQVFKLTSGDYIVSLSLGKQDKTEETEEKDE